MRSNCRCPHASLKAPQCFRGECSHAQRIAIVVTRQVEGMPEVVKTYYVVPEYKPPADDTDAAVVADAGVTAGDVKTWQFKV